MKRALLTLVSLLALLVGVLVVGALRVPAPAPAASAGTVVTIDSARAVERLAKAVRLQTISYGSGQPIDTAAFLGFHALVASEFPLAHAALTREVVGGLSLLYTWRGEDTTKAPVVLMGHMDVVPVPEANLAEWSQAPFSGAVAEGYVWGRGTLDDKTTVLSTLEAVEGLIAAGYTPSRTVYLTFGHDEEVGGLYGAKAIVDTLVARGVRPAMVIDEGGFMASGLLPGLAGRSAIVGIAEKGYVSLTLTAIAKGGHSSMPTERTAVGALARAVARLEATPFEDRLEGPTRTMLEALAPYMPFSRRLVLGNLWLTAPVMTRMLGSAPLGGALLHTTISPTMLDAGVKDNVLPPEATAVVNFRIRPGETVADVIAHVTAAVADTLVRVAPLDRVQVDPSPVSDVRSEAYQLIEETIRAMAPGVALPVVPYLVPGGTDAKHWSAHSDRVFRFLPVPLGDGDQARIHGVNERISVADYATAVGFFTGLLRGLDRLP